MAIDLKSLLPKDWSTVLKDEFKKDYFSDLQDFLSDCKDNKKLIHPADKRIFYALEQAPFAEVKVVILGQDPYHGQGQAMGLSFSVPRGIKIPPSLRNIFRELMTDQNMEYPVHGDLTSWTEQGVLLLNAILTVEHKSPASHSKIGWEAFTNKIIEELSDKRENLVFLLWGKYAQSKSAFIDREKHLVLEAAHPSPLARDKFQKCKHFSKANEYLIKHKKNAIIWQIK